MYGGGKNMKILIIGIAIVVVMGGLFFVSKNNSSNATPTTSASSLSMQQINDDVNVGGALIDVRTPAEFSEGHIVGATNLPLQDIQSGTLPKAEKDKPVYIYCRSGNRSAQAKQSLQAAGFSNITDLGAMTKVQSLGGEIKS